MKENEKLQIYFERYNSKYNRIYEQLTNIILVLIGSIAGYFIWKISAEMSAKNIQDFIIINQVTKIYFYVWVLLAFSVGVLSANLIGSGIRVHRIMRFLGR